MKQFGIGRVAGKRSQQISRAPSPLVAYLTPWATIVLASYLGGLPTIATTPWMPPLGFLALLAWRQLHPGLLPIRAGVPLGCIDDMVSGQPMGSAILTWSITMIALELIEFRWPWRNFLIEWAVAAGMIVAYILAAALIAHLAGGRFSLLLITPQLLLAVVVYPVVARCVARADTFRLTRFWAWG